MEADASSSPPHLTALGCVGAGATQLGSPSFAKWVSQGTGSAGTGKE